MEFISEKDVEKLINPGVTSFQLLTPHNSNSKKVTITRVIVEPGAVQNRHSHDTSEQIWIALNGIGKLLLANGQEKDFENGDIARFEDGEIHGLANCSSSFFEYIAITSPPLTFDDSYQERK